MTTETANETRTRANGGARRLAVGDTVHYFDEDCERHPAMITRLLPDNRVNLHVFFDAAKPDHRTSVPMAKAGSPGRMPNTAAALFGWPWPQPPDPYSHPGFGPPVDDSGDQSDHPRPG
jgi:hypothetical protein